MALDLNPSPGDLGYATSVELAFPSVEDFKSRIGILQAAMKRGKITVSVLGGAFNHLHLTGLHGLYPGRPIFLVVPQEGQEGFVSPYIETSQIAAKCAVPVVAEWREWTKEGMSRYFQDCVADYLWAIYPDRGNKDAFTIGVDYDGITAADLKLLTNAVGDTDIKDVSAMLCEVRRLNDDPTINVMRAGADVAVWKMKAISLALKAGRTEWEPALEGYVAQTMRNALWLKGDKNNSPLASSFIVMGSGAQRSENAHSVASCNVVEHGDIVEICCCTAPFRGHEICFDRPFRVGSGDLPEDIREMVDVAREAQAAAIAVLNPGVTAGEVYAAAMKVIKLHGFERLMQHGVGRSLGCGGPVFRFVEDDQTILKVGDVVGVEPGVAGYRYGDTFLITKIGYEELTPLSLFRYLE